MPEKYKRCVRKVARKGVDNPHAVCTAVDAGGIKAYRKRERKRKPKRGSVMGRVARGGRR